MFPRCILDRIVTPIPILCGINHDDYDEILRDTTEQEREMKTWVFLDRDVSRVQAELRQFAPFQGQQELDEQSGVRIVWGSEDQDLA